MEYRKLGNSGLHISEISLGTSLTFGQEISDKKIIYDIFKYAFDSGVNHVDLSSNYGDAESFFGSLIKNFDRNNIVLSSKCGWKIGDNFYDEGLSRKNIHQSLEKSLKNLNVNYIDIYYAHRYDLKCNLDEVCNTFNNLIRNGKILHWGTSEWPLEKLKYVYDYCEKNQLEKPIVDQTIFNYAVNKSISDGRLEFCKANNIGYLGYSVLCQGLLTGKYHKEGFNQGRIGKSKLIGYDKTILFYNQNKSRIDKYIKYCFSNKLDPVALSMAYSLKYCDAFLIGVSSIDQLKANIKSFKDSKKIIQKTLNEVDCF